MLGQDTTRLDDGRIVVKGRSCVVLCMHAYACIYDYVGEGWGMVKEGEKEQGWDRGRGKKKKRRVAASSKQEISVMKNKREEDGKEWLCVCQCTGSKRSKVNKKNG